MIRPLLDTRRASILSYLREREIPWREDASNQSDRFSRNRIRRALLPQLEHDWNPRITDILANMAEVAYEEEVHWTAQLGRLVPAALALLDRAVEVSVPVVKPLDPATQRRLLRHAMRLVKGDLNGIDHRHIEQATELLSRASGRRSLPGLTVVRSFDWLAIFGQSFASPEPVAIPEPGQYLWPSCKPLIRLEIKAALACDTLKTSWECVELRGWRPGDRYRPVGRSREVRLKELFQRARVPSWRRPSWPILTKKGKILWAKDFGPAVGSSAWQVRELLL
jgi:tRNA(Ile)-lysidine synthase